MTTATTPNRDRIVRVRFSALRTAADVQLDCEPMTVLIGPNGVGKSTLLEGLEILHKISSGPDFLRTLNEEHGGVSHLLRRGESELKLGVDITDGNSSLSYAMTLARRNGGFVIERESLHQGDEVLFARDGDTLVGSPSVVPQLAPGTLMKWPLLISMYGAIPPATRVSNALSSIEVGTTWSRPCLGSWQHTVRGDVRPHGLATVCNARG